MFVLLSSQPGSSPGSDPLGALTSTRDEESQQSVEQWFQERGFFKFYRLVTFPKKSEAQQKVINFLFLPSKAIKTQTICHHFTKAERYHLRLKIEALPRKGKYVASISPKLGFNSMCCSD